MDKALDLAADDPQVRLARKISTVLDRWFVDPILGFILPGAGDVVSATLGLYIVGVAIRRKLPGIVIARMLMYLAIDTVLGTIPFLGDVVDFFYRANERNLRLLATRPGRSDGRREDWIVVVGAFVLFALTLSIPVVLLVWAVISLITKLGGH